MRPLFGDAMRMDGRIQQAKALILEALKDHQKELTGVVPPDPERKAQYEALLGELGVFRGAQLLYPYLGSGIGRGPLVELMDGSVKYDFISGIGVHMLGHSHPDVIASSIEAACEDIVMQGHLQQNSEIHGVSQKLLEASGMDHCFLSTSGAMANENALKLVLHKQSPAGRLLAFEHCFAGRTWTLAQITDKASYRERLPMNVAVDYIPFFNPNEEPHKSIQYSLDILNKLVARYPKEHAAMIFELIQGEGGFYLGSHDFFKALMARCVELGISVFVDEIQTFGRTDKLFAYQHFNLEEYVDVVTVGKMLQICATLFKRALQPRPGLLSQTFSGGTMALRAGLVVLDHLLNKGILGSDGRNEQIFAHFRQKLENLSKRYPQLIQGPFGIGSMIAFTPMGGQREQVMEYLRRLFDEGVIAFAAGTNPTRVRFLVPAGVATDQDIDTVMEIVEKTLLETTPKETLDK